MSLIELTGTPVKYVEVAGVAWEACWLVVQNLAVLYESPDLAGTDRPLPHAASLVVPYPRFPAGTVKTLQLVISGKMTRVCALAGDPDAQLDDNVGWLREQCIDPPALGGLNCNADGTRNLVLHTAGGGTAAATAHMGPLRLPDAKFDSCYFATCQVSFPRGGFVLP